MEVVCGEIGDEAWGDLLLAWKVVKHVTSNGIVIAKDLQTIGICGGQPSRLEATKVAIERAQENGHDLSGAALASDSLFPSVDIPKLALEAGIKQIIQPGGSKGDRELIEAVSEAKGAMVFTHRRHLKH
jgi:phosphoribosylaminoimidazolecarboxamide formyltransferase/IMP cyclohydrolase